MAVMVSPAAFFSCKDEQSIVEYQKVWITRVSPRDGKAVDLLPSLSILAGQDDDGRGRMHHMTVRAAAKSEKEPVFEADKNRALVSEPDGMLGIGDVRQGRVYSGVEMTVSA